MMPEQQAKKNILFIVDALTTGGAQTAMCNVIESLDPQRYRPFVICLFKDGKVGDRLRKCGIFTQCLYLRSPFKVRNFLKCISILLKFARHHGIDLIHSFLTASGIYGGMVAKILGLRSILNVHAPLCKPEIVGKSRLRYLEMMARILNRTLIAGNQLTLRELRGLRISKNKNLEMIYNGIHASGESVVIPSEYETVTLTMVANFFPEKDHLTLIKAFEILRKTHPLKLQLIAEGDTDYQKEVLGYIEDRNISDIHIQPSRNEDTYTHKTDIFVLTSHSEGDPIVLKEAMSVGLPVVASDVGAVHEVIDDRKDGLLIPEASVDDLVGALSELIQNEELRRKLSQNAIRKFNEKFSIERMKERYRVFYLALFPEFGPGRS